jgi:hypothetical protein
MKAHRIVRFRLYDLGASLDKHGFQFKPGCSRFRTVKVLFGPSTVFRISAALNFRSRNFKLITQTALNSLNADIDFLTFD